LADALRGELKAVRAELKSYRVVIASVMVSPPVGHAKPAAVIGKIDRTLLASELAQVPNIGTPIYNVNHGEVGMLWNRLSKEVVEFYGDSGALKRYSQRIVVTTDDGELVRRVKMFSREIEALVLEVGALNERVNEVSEAVATGNPYPKSRDKHLV